MDNNEDTTPPSSVSPASDPVPPSIPPDSDGPVLQPTDHSQNSEPAPKKHKYLLPLIMLLVVVVAGAGVAYAYYHSATNKTPKQSTTATSNVTTKSNSSQVSNANVWKATVDPKALPLGDGHVSTTPKVGYVDSCTTTFNGRGAFNAGS